MFSKFHIAREGISLCHAREGILIPFDEAAMMNPAKCCEDCRLRFRNITGIDIRKKPINKALLREKTKINKTLSHERKKPSKSLACNINTRH